MQALTELGRVQFEGVAEPLGFSQIGHAKDAAETFQQPALRQLPRYQQRKMSIGKQIDSFSGRKPIDAMLEARKMAATELQLEEAAATAPTSLSYRVDIDHSSDDGLGYSSDSISDSLSGDGDTANSYSYGDDDSFG